MPVYFVQPVDGGPIKIGHSVNVPTRLKELETIYARPLALLATIPGGRDEERAIHERFSALRFGKTEQFRPESDLLAFIGCPLFVSAVPVVEPMESKDTRKPVVLVVRGAPEWAEWLSRLAEHCRASASELADDALVAYAKLQGFTEKPPKR